MILLLSMNKRLRLFFLATLKTYDGNLSLGLGKLNYEMSVELTTYN